MAARYGINIIPEIDVPAHSLAFTHYNPILAADKKEYGMDHLDLYKKEVYDFLFAEAADYVMMQTISGETEKTLEMDGLLKDAGQYAAHYEGEPAIEQTEEPPLTADDVQNLDRPGIYQRYTNNSL